MTNRFRQNAGKTLRTFISIFPIVFGMLLLTSLAITLFPEQIAGGVFGKHIFIDAFIGAAAGSVAAGHPLASYILGGELLSSGVSMFAVTALIVSWVSVGVVQLPAEALLLGKRFALTRNLVCFLFAIAISFATVYTLQLIE